MDRGVEIMTTTMEKREKRVRSWHISSPNWLILLGLLWFSLGAGIFISGFSSEASIEIQWETESEFDTAGFNIYRSNLPDGEFVQINPQLIPSQADPASGASYTFVDTAVESGQTYYYMLEDVEYNNARETHDVITGQARQFDWMQTVLAAVSFVFGFVLLGMGLKETRQQ